MKKNVIYRCLNNCTPKLIVKLSIILFLIQAYVFYNCYFITGWDSEVVVRVADAIAMGNQEILTNDWYEWYFSTYPNNKLMVIVFAILLKLNSYIGFIAEKQYFLILFLCMLSCLTGYLLFKTIEHMSNSVYAYFAWFLYVIHVGISPWLFIPYSDSLGLIFPLAIVRIYQKLQNRKHVLFKWAIIGAGAYFGYNIKPQILITMIALLIIDVLQFLKQCNKKMFKAYIKNYCICFFSMFLAMIINVNIILPCFAIETEKELAVGPTHYMMMGLNSNSYGGYDYDDVVFSTSFDNKKDRKENNIQKIKERIEGYGFWGLGKFMIHKIAYIYHTGTYAWRQEGRFIVEIIEDRNNLSSPLLKKFYYNNEENKECAFDVMEYVIWLTMLTCAVGVAFCEKQSFKNDPTYYVIIISLIGLNIFELLFEARGRYLFIYSPFYVFVALFGLKGWKNLFMMKKWKLKAG